VVSSLGRALLAVTDRSVVRSMFTGTGPGRLLATRFVAGETIDDAEKVARTLNDNGFRVSLDHLGEHVTDRSQAALARDDYLACLDRIDTGGLDANISIKLTQLGLGVDDDLAAASLDALAERAAAFGLTVTIDMEESRHTEATIALFERVQRRRGNLGIAIQAYLRRTRDDVDRIVAVGGHVRLCKGAYAEPEGVAYQSRDGVDASFDRLAMLLIGAEAVLPAIASHDDARIEHAKKLVSERTGYYEFQMLYGVRTPLQRQLLDEGLPVRIYVPYGQAWYPYLTRRMAERPANLWFFLRAATSRS
jgi:proline dehydrogenase